MTTIFTVCPVKCETFRNATHFLLPHLFLHLSEVNTHTHTHKHILCSATNSCQPSMVSLRQTHSSHKHTWKWTNLIVPRSRTCELLIRVSLIEVWAILPVISWTVTDTERIKETNVRPGQWPHPRIWTPNIGRIRELHVQHRVTMRESDAITYKTSIQARKWKWIYSHAHTTSWH